MAADDESNWFEKLPPEMVLQIFTFVPTKELLKTVRLVCRRFDRLITNTGWWQSRIQNDTQIVLPVCEKLSDDFEPARFYHEAMCEEKRWKRWKFVERKTAVGHLSTVDAMCIFRRDGKRMCISGSRDRDLKLWNVTNIHEDKPVDEWKAASKAQAHNGWIWHVDIPRGDTFLSSGWDEYVRVWQLRPEGFENLSSLSVKAAVTSVKSLSDSLAVCSTFRREVIFLDRNNGLDVVSTCSFHRAPIFKLAVLDNYVYSIGEDKRLIMVDCRNTSKEVANLRLVHDTPTSMSVCDNLLINGTNNGNIRIGDPNTLKLIKTYHTGMSSPMQQVMHCRGSVIAMSRKRSLKIFTSGIEPGVRVNTHELESEPACFEYFKGDLAISNGMGEIMFWTCPDDIDY